MYAIYTYYMYVCIHSVRPFTNKQTNTHAHTRPNCNSTICKIYFILNEAESYFTMQMTPVFHCLCVSRIIGIQKGNIKYCTLPATLRINAFASLNQHF